MPYSGILGALSMITISAFNFRDSLQSIVTPVERNYLGKK